MLKNAYLDAKIGVDPAENEPPKEGDLLLVEQQLDRPGGDLGPGVRRPRLAPLRAELRRNTWLRPRRRGTARKLLA